MDKRDIRELQGFYVAAAERAREAGFDLILVYGAETIPITQQFLMPYFNRRSDEYGGSFENRARFFREVLELVREAVGDDCAIGVALLGRHCSGRGVGIEVGEDGVRFVEHVDHLVDLWDVQVGPAIAEWSTDRRRAASRVRGENYQKPWVEQVRPHTSKPIVGVGRFTNPDTMVSVIRSGQLDIIGAARPSIADPFLPRKIEEGRLDEIRECIGCNICLSRFKQGGARLVCTQNPTSGEEFRRGWHPERFTRARNADNDVLVVGAGPAGMECAIVLGKRGMRRVHLVDAGRRDRWLHELDLAAFGHSDGKENVFPARRGPRRVGARGRLPPDPARQARSNVEVHRNVAARRRRRCSSTAPSSWSSRPARHFAPDGLNAASARADRGRRREFRLDWQITPEQIMLEGTEPPGESVLIYDCEGYFAGASLAEKLCRGGPAEVHIVTPTAAGIAKYIGFTPEAPMLHRRRFHRLGVQWSTAAVDARADRAEHVCRAYNVCRTRRTRRRSEADSVVLGDGPPPPTTRSTAS